MVRKALLTLVLSLVCSAAHAQLVAQAQWPASSMPNVSTTFTFIAVQSNGLEEVQTTDQYLDSGQATVVFQQVDPELQTAILVRSTPVSSGGKTYSVRPKLYAIAPAWASAISFAIQWVIS